MKIKKFIAINQFAGTLSLVLALLAFTSIAEACRGSHEYPAAFKKLQQSQISAEMKAKIQKELENGQAIHNQAHDEGSNKKKRESLKILDSIKGKI